VLCAKTVPQQKNRVKCGAFVCMYCYYISHDSCLDFDESIIAKFQKTIALSILNGKGAGDRSDVTQVLKFILLLQGQVNLLPLETFLKVLLKFVKTRLITKEFQELLLKMNFMLSNCTTNYPKKIEDFCKNMLTNISQN
jgi:hypothetical protein